MTYENDFGAFLDGHGIEHFSPHELCPVGKLNNGARLKAPPCEMWDNIIPTLKVLEWLRAELGAPILINSGYRDLAYNRAVGSTPASQHVRFTATDIRVPGHTPRAVFNKLETHPDADTFGLGIYPSFVHLDTRGVRARW